VCSDRGSYSGSYKKNAIVAPVLIVSMSASFQAIAAAKTAAG
jgi:hypothetical protein